MKRAKDDAGTRSDGAPTHIVAIGGSAGSLGAIEQLLAHVPARSGAAYVIVTHRDPHGRELLTGILTRYSASPVRTAEDGERILRDTVYVVPAGVRGKVVRGRFAFRRTAEEAGQARTAIDSLFTALAKDAKERAVGVILSGMGSDGTKGLTAIRAAGGLAVVQAPESAEFDGMPRSAIEARLADVVAPPDVLAGEIAAHLERGGRPAVEGTAAERAERDVDTVLALVLATTGQDFSSYKRKTVLRRIERRMSAVGAADLGAYVAALRADPREAERLFGDMLISVTSFFRDPEMWSALGEKAIPAVFQHGSPDGPIRAWVAGCATGEEAYSLAIALHEHSQTLRRTPRPRVQIYATDVDKVAIDRARRGVYPRSIAADVSPDRLARYFVAEEAGFRIKKEIRDMIVFATQNVVSDPPFTRLDILSCRNLLIYLAPELQKKVLSLFFHALKPGGVLVLGASESVGDLARSFVPLSSTWKIFERAPAFRDSEARLEYPIGAGRPPGHPLEDVARAEAPVADTVRRAIVDEVAPPVMVVDAKGDLVFASQRAGKYFEPPAGRANVNVFAMARGGLETPLRLAVRRAASSKRRVTQRGIRFGRGSAVDLTVAPLKEPPALRGHFMVILEAVPSAARAKKKSAHDVDARSELRRAHGQLRLLAKEMQHSEEELRSTNEELQSTNEELQSTNEELTTSKEEMQSMNEELLTLNAELQAKNEQLAIANDDMRNLLDASQFPTLFLDRTLRLKRFTFQARQIANLLPGDVGRPITDINLGLDYTSLASDAEEVLATLVPKELQVAGKTSSYAMRIHPYRTMDDVIDGVVVTFVDVTAMSSAALAAAERRQGDLIAKIVEAWPGIAYVEESVTGRCVAASAYASVALGCAPAVLASATPEVWRAFRHADDRAAAGRPFRLRLADGTFHRFTEEVSALSHALALHVVRPLPDEEAKEPNGHEAR